MYRLLILAFLELKNNKRKLYKFLISTTVTLFILSISIFYYLTLDKSLNELEYKYSSYKNYYTEVNEEDLPQVKQYLEDNNYEYSIKKEYIDADILKPIISNVYKLEFNINNKVSKIDPLYYNKYNYIDIDDKEYCAEHEFDNACRMHFQITTFEDNKLVLSDNEIKQLEYYDMNTDYLLYGNLINDDKQIIISDYFLEALGYQDYQEYLIGEKITITNDEHVIVDNYEIVGILNNAILSGYNYNYGNGSFITSDTYNNKDLKESIYVIVYLEDYTDLNEVSTNISGYFYPDLIYALFEDLTLQKEQIASVFIIISLLVVIGLILKINIDISNYINSKNRYLGICKSYGYSTNDLILINTIILLLINVIALLINILLTAIIFVIIYFVMNITIYISVVLITYLYTLVFTLILSFICYLCIRFKLISNSIYNLFRSN